MDYLFYVRCTRNKLWFGKDKNMLTMSSYKKLISHDLNFLQKFISFVHAFPGTSSTEGKRRRKKIIGVKELMTYNVPLIYYFNETTQNI